MEMPDGARVKDVLPRLGISADQGAVSSIKSKLVPLSHSLNHGDEVKIMQLAMGG